MPRFESPIRLAAPIWCFGLLVLLTLIVLMSPIAAAAGERARVQVAVGEFNASDDLTPSAAMALMELHGARRAWGLRPAAGLAVNEEAGFVAYAGLSRDFALARWVLAPLVALAAYEAGGGRDLGGTFQFRTALALARELPGGHRIGLWVAHVSNADLHERNPGENEILLGWSMPLSP